MPLELDIVNPLDYPDWDKLVFSTTNCSFFYSSAWAEAPDRKIDSHRPLLSPPMPPSKGIRISEGEYGDKILVRYLEVTRGDIH